MAGTGGCFCAPAVLDCGQQTAPACNGNCPDGQVCEPAILGSGCECKPAGALCQDVVAPVCGGGCPAGSRCAANSTGGCECRACNAIVPSSHITILWGSKTHFEWNEPQCATSYNVYRKTAPHLTDTNGDGVADDYGTCFLSGLTTAQANDTMVPPVGSLHHYLVTGKSSLGEGSLGFAGNGQLRPNSPCP